LRTPHLRRRLPPAGARPRPRRQLQARRGASSQSGGGGGGWGRQRCRRLQMQPPLPQLPRLPLPPAERAEGTRSGLWPCGPDRAARAVLCRRGPSHSAQLTNTHDKGCARRRAPPASCAARRASSAPGCSCASSCGRRPPGGAQRTDGRSARRTRRPLTSLPCGAPVGGAGGHGDELRNGPGACGGRPHLWWPAGCRPGGVAAAPLPSTHLADLAPMEVASELQEVRVAARNLAAGSAVGLHRCSGVAGGRCGPSSDEILRVL
jgi:hypothetical protein